MIDFGTGGLDLAYEVMRGYDALVLVDVSRQGGEPGTLYVMEAEPGRRRRPDRGRRRCSTRTAWTRRPCCGSSSTSAAGPGRVVVDRLRAGRGRGVGFGLSDRGRGRGRARGRRSCSRRSRSCAGADAPMHELSLASAVVDTASSHADGRPVTRRAACASGALRQVVPDSLAFYFEHRRARHASARARGWSSEIVPARLRCDACEHEWELDDPGLPLPALRVGATSRSLAGEELEVESIEVEEGGRMHRTKVRVVEDALDANNTIARANRDDFDRARRDAWST